MTDRISTGKDKIIYVEILRIIAIVCVIFNHTQTYGYMHFTLYSAGTAAYWFFMLFSVACKISVPLFFMISGMLLLGKEESVGFVWKKRVLKYVIVLFLFSLFHYLWETIPAGLPFSIGDFLKITYSKGVIEQFWFLYAYLAFLMALPFIRKIAVNMNGTELKYLFGIQLAFGLISVVEYRLSCGTLSINPVLIPLMVTGQSVFYPLTGYYLGNRQKEVSGKTCRVFFALSMISIALTMYITDYRIGLTGDMSPAGTEFFYSSLLSLQVVFVFLLAKKNFENRKLPDALTKILTVAGGAVFGIYLIEKMVRESFFDIYFAMCKGINSFAAILIYVLFVFAVSALIVAGVRFLAGLIISMFRTSERKVS